MLNDKKCLPNVLWVAQNGAEESERAEALAVLPNFYVGSPEVPPEKVLSTICGLLADGSNFVRVNAAAALQTIGTSKQAACIEAVLPKQTDDTVRGAMEQAMDALRKRPAK